MIAFTFNNNGSILHSFSCWLTIEAMEASIRNKAKRALMAQMRKNKEARKEEMDEVEKFREAEMNNLKLLLLQGVLLQEEVDKATKGGQLEALITKGKEQAKILKKEQQVIEEKKKEKAMEKRRLIAQQSPGRFFCFVQNG